MRARQFPSALASSIPRVRTERTVRTQPPQRTSHSEATPSPPPDHRPTRAKPLRKQRMPATQLQALLSDLTEDFQARQTDDVLQFCADWFQARLKAEVSGLLCRLCRWHDGIRVRFFSLGPASRCLPYRSKARPCLSESIPCPPRTASSQLILSPYSAPECSPLPHLQHHPLPPRLHQLRPQPFANSPTSPP